MYHHEISLKTLLHKISLLCSIHIHWIKLNQCNKAEYQQGIEMRDQGKGMEK